MLLFGLSRKRTRRECTERRTYSESLNSLNPSVRYLADIIAIFLLSQLAHLREQATYCRILGSYPQKSRLVGPVASEVEEMKHMVVDPKEASLMSLPSDSEGTRTLNIGIIGFGAFGQSLATQMTKKHRVTCMDKMDMVRIAMSRAVTKQRHHSSSILTHFFFLVVPGGSQAGC